MSERDERALFMISVAATLAGMHPQTLRIYEQRRLIEPQRTAKGTRLYSQANVDRLRRIQELTNEGMNLAGVERVFALEDQIARQQRRIAALERRAEQIQQEAAIALERMRRQFKAELVPYTRPGTSLASTRRPVTGPTHRIKIERTGESGGN